MSLTIDGGGVSGAGARLDTVADEYLAIGQEVVGALQSLGTALGDAALHQSVTAGLATVVQQLHVAGAASSTLAQRSRTAAADFTATDVAAAHALRSAGAGLF